MIASLHGLVTHKQPPLLILDVNGVGYELQAPMSTFYALPENSQPVTLYVHMAIRDDAHVLYAFVDLVERALFRDLLKVNGVGGKMALAILSSMSMDAFNHNIQNGDVAALTRIPGIGKRTAERLVIEMRDRISQSAHLPTNPATANKSAMTTSPADEALDALLALGYKQNQAVQMLKGIEQDGLSTEEIIRQALQAHK